MFFDDFFLAHYAWALGKSSTIRKNLDETYRANRKEYYDYARNSLLYSHNLFTRGSIFLQDYSYKALGILICYQKTNDNFLLGKLRRMFEKAYVYCKQYVTSRKAITYEDFIEYYYRKARIEVSHSTTTPDAAVFAMFFLASCYQVDVNKETHGYKNFIEGMKIKFTPIINFRISYRKNPIYTTEYKPHCEYLIERLHEKRKITNSFCDTIENLDGFDSYIMLPFTYNMSFQDIFGDLQLESEDLEGIAFYFLLSNPKKKKSGWTKQDLDEILNDFVEFFRSAVYIQGLLKAYEDAKYVYFKNNRDVLSIELKEKDQLISNLNQELVKAKLALENSTKENEHLARENRHRQEKINKHIDHEKELVALRELAFSLENNIRIPNEKRTIDPSLFTDLSVTIVGGLPTWQKKVKDIYPSFKCVAADSYNFDPYLVKSADFVFVNTTYIGHKMYYKTVENIGESTQLYFVNASNIERTINCIENVINNK